MSSDWWTQSSTYNTPQRPSSLVHSTSQNHLANSHAHSSRNGMGMHRYNHPMAGDELDAEDARMADSIKFLPSFANSPAGKLALGMGMGGSPQNTTSSIGAGSGAGGGGSGGGGGAGGGAGGGLGQSPQERRSPNARFSISQDRDSSSRHTRTRTLVHQNSLNSSTSNANGNSGSGGGSGVGVSNGPFGGMAMDEDMPPTASLRDGGAGDGGNGGGTGAGGSRVQDASTPLELPLPPSLIPNASTTTLHIFGPPTSTLSTLQPYLAQFGPITSYKSGPEGSNWYIVEYASPLSASYALRRHGDIINGCWMLGFKVAQPGSTAGCTLVANGAGGQGQGGQVARQDHREGAGTPMQVRKADIIRQKPQNQPSKPEVNSDYAWDEPDAPQNGWSSWVSERLFGR